MVDSLQKSATRDAWQIATVVIADIRDETPDVSTYRLQWPEQEVQPAGGKPGQFNMLYMPGVGEAAISISGDTARPDQIVHTIRSVGNVTGAIDRLQVGSTLGLRGPFGSYWPIDACVGGDVMIVGGGIGMAPLRPVVYELMHRRHEFAEVHLLIGARTPGDLLYSNEYAAWEAGGVNVETTVDRAKATWTGNIGVVTLLMERLKLARPNQTSLMTCGPEVMMTYAIQSALARGLERKNIWLSLERNMNCAIGTCGHCQFGPHFVCKDGPVIRFDRVEKLMEVTDL